MVARAVQPPGDPGDGRGDLAAGLGQPGQLRPQLVDSLVDPTSFRRQFACLAFDVVARKRIEALVQLPPSG